MEKPIAFGIVNKDDVIILSEPLVVDERVDWLSGEEFNGVWKRGLLIIPNPSEETRERIREIRILTPSETLDEETFTYALDDWRIIHVKGVASFSEIRKRTARLLGWDESEVGRRMDKQVMSYYEDGFIDLDERVRLLVYDCGFILAEKQDV